MKTRDNLLGRISHRPEGEYYCIICCIKDGVPSFDSGRSWCRYAAGIGHTCFISVEDKDSQLTEQRLFDLEKGIDVYCLRFGEDRIETASNEIISSFQKWKSRPDVIVDSQGKIILQR